MDLNQLRTPVRVSVERLLEAPESGRPQAVYLKSVVEQALANRPARRTDLKDAE
jgi:hypothetical protein